MHVHVIIQVHVNVLLIYIYSGPPIKGPSRRGHNRNNPLYKGHTSKSLFPYS